VRSFGFPELLHLWRIRTIAFSLVCGACLVDEGNFNWGLSRCCGILLAPLCVGCMKSVLSVATPVYHEKLWTGNCESRTSATMKCETELKPRIKHMGEAFMTAQARTLVAELLTSLPVGTAKIPLILNAAKSVQNDARLLAPVCIDVSTASSITKVVIGDGESKTVMKVGLYSKPSPGVWLHTRDHATYFSIQLCRSSEKRTTINKNDMLLSRST
jgi:hypothetical protein